MKKSDLTDIDRQIYKLAVECEKTALPRSKTAGNRNGSGIPLTAWMDAIESGSKILSVVDERKRRAPAMPMRIHIERIVERLLSKKQLTIVQADCLIDIFASRYRGWPNHVSKWLSIPKNVIPCKCGHLLDFYAIKATPKAPRMPITLKFILSDQLTDLILLKQLFSTVQEAKNAPNKPNHHRR